MRRDEVFQLIETVDENEQLNFFFTITDLCKHCIGQNSCFRIIQEVFNRLEPKTIQIRATIVCSAKVMKRVHADASSQLIEPYNYLGEIIFSDGTDGTDRQQPETFSLKIHFRSGNITAILRKTTGGNLQPDQKERKFPCRSVTFRRSVPSE
uniref:Uncharacterized protein n=1 Tax=Romanomermis culicivorax TaxID=13658 RepID=A0A915ID21_ROMCU